MLAKLAMKKEIRPATCICRRAPQRHVALGCARLVSNAARRRCTLTAACVAVVLCGGPCCSRNKSNRYPVQPAFSRPMTRCGKVDSAAGILASRSTRHCTPCDVQQMPQCVQPALLRLQNKSRRGWKSSSAKFGNRPSGACGAVCEPTFGSRLGARRAARLGARRGPARTRRRGLSLRAS